MLNWAEVNASEHAVQFYGDEEYLLDDLSRFVGAALGGGDAALVIATPEHRAELIRQLQARGFDMKRAIAEGRYTDLDAAATLARFLRDGWPDPVRFAGYLGSAIQTVMPAARSAQPRVAAIGEMVALLWAEGKAEAALRVEQLWNELTLTYPLSLRCAYPLALFGDESDGDLIARVCAEHRHVIPAETYTALSGEVERLNSIALLQQKAQALENQIAERKRIEQELRQTNEELRQAVSARDDFLCIAAHELKTPVTSLRGFAQLLLRDARRGQNSTPERLALALEAVEAQTGKLNRLVARLLDSAQIDTGKLLIEPVQADLVAIVRAALAQQQVGASHRFLVETPDTLETLVDALRFEQVVTNLLDNAVKFSPPGGTVALCLRNDGDGAISLSVTDDGAGVAPEDRQAVFDRFRRGQADTHTSGMGLGLHITREIVQLHGGSVRVEAAPNGGARFVVTLPALPAKAFAAPVA